ncbi:MAG: cellobiose phosphorylase [Candidatus Omnitrophica bacterium]|nr:cellobiose phosphorylase [Candidatus Omnitrophota bacterium]
MNGFHWKFTDTLGSFASRDANRVNTLYFPLCNEYPLMASITPDLHGDLKSGFNSFLLEPVSRLDLSNLKSSRNFWLYLNENTVWSATGVSHNRKLQEKDEFLLEAGLLWQQTSRKNRFIGLSAKITSFIPATKEPVEIMFVEISNISGRTLKFTPTAAIPVYARSANNLHDHRHVTSLLNRVERQKSGVVVTPTLYFDESGHKNNTLSYFILGIDKEAGHTEQIFTSQEDFCADDSDLEWPRAVIDNLPAPKNAAQGKEVLAGLRFKEKTLAPGKSCSFTILMGICAKKDQIPALKKKFDREEKVRKSLRLTRKFWQEKSDKLQVKTADPLFDNWLRWVNIQPDLRKIFGCSFLPDFDYGRGGRGWRDLWQDCLSLILTHPRLTRELLINNFKGVRIDGSNATIIGQAAGEFIADRNNITRIWMDHGIWPLLSIQLYINQSADLKILLEKTTYFRDPQLWRSRKKDSSWTPACGNKLKDKNNRAYCGTLLEHILIQHLVQFFNVGRHNHIRLENADWNDGLDMAFAAGESVAFTAMYAHNLSALSEIILRLPVKNICLLKELTILLDTTRINPVDYSSYKAKLKNLERYFRETESRVSGKTILLSKEKLARDLKIKSDWITKNIRKKEWVKPGFFNGYYDNRKRRVEGVIGGQVRMTLSGQAFPIISGIADARQVKTIFHNASRYLRCAKFGGFRLNSDFGSQQQDLGRAFSFVYGDKENGAFFSHMAIIFAYALYQRRFIREAYQVIDSIYRMAVDTQTSKTYPCLPEYFDAGGRGMYSYLTGSASWFIFTLLTQVFGIKGEFGDLVIEPKLTTQQFNRTKTLSLKTVFAERNLEVSFTNRRKKGVTDYMLEKLVLNGRVFPAGKNPYRITIPRKTFLKITNRKSNNLEVILI